MKIHRLYAIILRNAFFFRHSLDRWTDAFWWPTIDIVTWGLTSVYFQTHANVFPPVVWYIISGIVLWIFVYRSQFEINVGLDRKSTRLNSSHQIISYAVFCLKKKKIIHKKKSNKIHA